MRRLIHNLSKGILLFSLFSLLFCPKVSAQAIVQLGTDTTHDNIYSPIAISPWAKNTHFQQLYTAAELNALGITAASFIDSLAIDVYEAPVLPLPGYSIKAKNSSAPSITTFDGIGLSQLYTASTYTPVAGQWNWFHFQNPFFWDGSSNIIIDFCFDTTATTPSVFYSGKVRYSESIVGGTAVFRSGASQCNQYSDPETFFNRTNVKLSMRTAPACVGTPPAPVLISGSTFNVCPSQPVTLNVTSTATGSGLTWSWQKSMDNGATWQTIPGLSGNSATFSVGTDTTQFRAQLTCSNTSQTSSSTVAQINPNSSGLIYRTLPYTQDFEQWQSRCANLELPDSNWAAAPPTGDQSWRREDQGDSASWTGEVAPYYYMPLSSTGSHSARFHTSAGNSTGSLSVYVDCSGPGNKGLRFDYMNKTYSGSNANMEVLVSTDAGISFTPLATLNSMGVNAEWQPQLLDIVSTSATTVIKFNGQGEQQWGDFDMGLDNLRILPACNGVPLAGTVDSNTACTGDGVQLSLTGSTAAGGLSWLWQQSTNGISWDDVIGGTQETSTAPLTQNTWFRCVVSCSVSGMSDTTAPRLLQLKPFYHCYCNSSSTGATPWVNIGNVKLVTLSGADTLIDNGNPLPQSENLDAKKHYTNYTGLGAANVTKDSTYQIDLRYFTSAGQWSWPVMWASFTKLYIDYNHNSVFDTDELAWQGSKPDDIYLTTGNLTVPGTALPGITGMRIVTNTDGFYDSTVVDPCGPYYGGETEDYLLNIQNTPCGGTIDAGAIATADTVLCPGYMFTILHNGYDSLSGYTERIWQSSTNGAVWSDIAGTENIDTLASQFTSPIWYRVKSICESTGSNSFTNELKMNQNTICYCVSYADGGFAGMADSSDVGGFSFLSVNHALSGGHLNNSLAVSKHTDFTNEAVTELNTDSTYSFSLDHILLRNTHADAKITMFMDFNCNGTYDIPSERVYSGQTTASTWHKTANISIPANATSNTVTGMRVIINNNTAANAPSDEACGIYTSGETEDYLLKFKSKTVGTNDMNIEDGNITLFPNPSNGTVTIEYKGSTIEHVSLQVQTLSGQSILDKELIRVKNKETIKLDLSAFAKGIYFIRLTTGQGSRTAKVVLQ